MINRTIKDIFIKIDNNEMLDKQEAILLLNIDNHSSDFYDVISKANELSRNEYKNKGYIFAQIGLDSAPCSGNCKFCSLARDSFAIGGESYKEMNDILDEVKIFVDNKVDAIFLMTTVGFSWSNYLEISKKAKVIMPDSMKLVANIGDFDLEKAMQLKAVGFSSVYHIVRLNEGIDTDISVQTRIDTLDAIKAVGLEIIYCIEPIGPEHTYEQLAEEMLRGREYNVDIMAVMRRVCVKNTPLEEKGEITELETTKIVAVTRLVTRPKISMNVHEPLKMPLLSGVNQLYAEIGINPRDTDLDTRVSRGFTVEYLAKMLSDAGYSTDAMTMI